MSLLCSERSEHGWDISENLWSAITGADENNGGENCVGVGLGAGERREKNGRHDGNGFGGRVGAASQRLAAAGSSKGH